MEGDSRGGGGAELGQKELASLPVSDLGISGLIPACRVPMFHCPGLLTAILLRERIHPICLSQCGMKSPCYRSYTCALVTWSLEVGCGCDVSDAGLVIRQ